jgi:redox-sensitive bicupin YhaK (pirin superfamily)
LEQAAGNKMIGSLKKVNKVFSPTFKKEGVGADVMRVIGDSGLPRLDPFLMMDYFHVKLPAGFPDHPHRGIYFFY